MQNYEWNLDFFQKMQKKIHISSRNKRNYVIEFFSCIILRFENSTWDWSVTMVNKRKI